MKTKMERTNKKPMGVVCLDLVKKVNGFEEKGKAYQPCQY
jgi:hypothetical protein